MLDLSGVLLRVLCETLHFEEYRREPLVHAFIVEYEDYASEDGVKGTIESANVSEEVQEGVGRPCIFVQVRVQSDLEFDR